MWLASGGRCSWCASSRRDPSGSRIFWRGCLASELTSSRTGSRALEGEGIVRRATLPPPAGSNVYELTELGGSLEPVIVALSRWGARLLDAPREEDDLRAGWAAVAMRSALGRGTAGGRPGTYEFRIDGEAFHVRVRDGEEGERVEVRQGPPQILTWSS